MTHFSFSDTLLCCDWGSSSFRLQWVDRRDAALLGEYQSADGAAPTYRRWRTGGGQDRVDFYLDVLTGAARALSKKVGRDLSGVPLLISGMASSSIGLKELSYAELPFKLNGEDAVWEKLEAAEHFPPGIWLISGVRAEADVMRGEEVQIIGLSRQLNIENGLYIMPGTHSKHIRVENGSMVDFKTYMTGELFQTTREHTMLSASLSVDGDSLPDDDRFFHLGVSRALHGNYLNVLFSVRTNQLLEGYSPRENYYYHSGLHIGYELKSLLELKSDFPIYLCGGRAVVRFYRLAIEALGVASSLTVIPVETISKAAAGGMLSLYQNQMQE